jgi:hypothetical protein
MRVLWWADGEHPVAKAALFSQGANVSLQPLTSSSDSNQATVAIRKITMEIQSRRADAAVLLLSSAGAATVHANRQPELRAVVGTSVYSLAAAMTSVKPNVLIIEQSDRSIVQTTNLLCRFFRGGGST